MHLARFTDKITADIFGVLFKRAAHFRQSLLSRGRRGSERAGSGLLGLRLGRRSAWFRAGCAAGLYAGGHDGFFDLGVTAKRTANHAMPGQLVIGIGRLEPTVKPVILRTFKRKLD